MLSRIWDESSLPSSEMAVTLAALIYLRWADFQEAEQEAIAAFDDTDYKPILHSSLHWRSWHLLPTNELQALFTKHLPDVLEQLHNSRHISLATHLHRIAATVKNIGRLSPQALDWLIHWLADQPFETPGDRRVLLDSFDTLLDKSRDKHTGEYRTPANIAQLLVSFSAPSVGEHIYDPCFGSAGSLTAAFDYARGKATEPFTSSGSPPLQISGVEINLEAYIIGLVRLTLAGVDDPQIEYGNALERTPANNPQRDGFDVVLANPPWGWKAQYSKKNRWGLHHFSFMTNEGSGLFVQHALQQLKPNGRAVIVVPEGLIFRKGPDQQLRRFLVENHTIEAVVSLPPATFMPYSSIKSNILVLRRGGHTERIRMIDAEPFFDKGKGSKPAELSQNRIEELVQEFRGTKPGKNSWDVDPETLSDADWDFTVKRRDQSGLVSVLDAIKSEVGIVPFNKCGKILTGRPFSKVQLLDTPPYREASVKQPSLFPKEKLVGQQNLFDVPIIPYVRIKDIHRGQATKGSSWLSRDAIEAMDARWKLRAGDVLLSKSGTVGKTGVVRNGAVGAVAAGSLFVLRVDHDRLDAHFLAAYLDSNKCRTWLNDRARGATIRHLSKRIIAEMPIPLPPLQIQKRIATQYREHAIDALEFLAQLLTKGEDDPIAAWVDRTVAGLPLDIQEVDNPLDLYPLERLAADIKGVRNQAVHEDTGSSGLTTWMHAFSEAVSGLRGIHDIPQGPGLLSVLQESIRALDQTMLLIEGILPNEVKARGLTKLVAAWIERACSVLLGLTNLEISTDKTLLPMGETVEVLLGVHNQGPLPLRNLQITTRPEWGGGKVAYLSEGAKAKIRLNGTSPKTLGRYTISVKWSAGTLDGKSVEAAREIAFEIVDATSDVNETVLDFGGSPYVCGDPIQPERNDVFFGRDELLEQICRQIIHSGNVVLLEGNRRSGKSSVLMHLEGKNAVPGWLGIYCSLQGAEGSREGAGVPTVEVFREMAKSIAKGLQTLGEQTLLPDGTLLPPGKKLGIAKACRNGISEESSFSDFQDYVEAALEILAGQNLGLLLMLDEFDKLQEGIESRVTSPQVLENIRFLVQTYPQFCTILTGQKRLKRLREEHWSALYGLGTRFGVSSLSVEHARRLVTEPVKDRLTYTPEAVEKTIFLSSGQPYLLQCLCNRIFDMSARLKTRSVNLDLVNKAGNALVIDNEHFASLWDYAGSDQRRFIIALCHKESDGPDLLRLGVIEERLASHGIEIKEETLIEDLESLRELELIKLAYEDSAGNYILAIPLMGIWIEKQHDFAAIKRKARLETED
jgi:type I restriction enzyme M protein